MPRCIYLFADSITVLANFSTMLVHVLVCHFANVISSSHLQKEVNLKKMSNIQRKDDDALCRIELRRTSIRTYYVCMYECRYVRNK